MNLEILLDPSKIIETVGLIGIIFIIFAESGLFFGFFLPGDSLLFTAGLLAYQGILNIYALLIFTFLAAVIGDNVGYFFGKKTGPHLFKKEDSIFFHKSHILKAQNFYEKHGKKTIILARFIPIIRTFAPIVAGIGNMNYKTFFTFNIIGGFIWTWGLLGIGYFVGRIFPEAERYLTLIILFIIFISLIPPIIEFIKHRKL